MSLKDEMDRMLADERERRVLIARTFVSTDESTAHLMPFTLVYVAKLQSSTDPNSTWVDCAIHESGTIGPFFKVKRAHLLPWSEVEKATQGSVLRGEVKTLASSLHDVVDFAVKDAARKIWPVTPDFVGTVSFGHSGDKLLHERAAALNARPDLKLYAKQEAADDLRAGAISLEDVKLSIGPAVPGGENVLHFHKPRRPPELVGDRWTDYDPRVWIVAPEQDGRFDAASIVEVRVRRGGYHEVLAQFDAGTMEARNEWVIFPHEPRVYLTRETAAEAARYRNGLGDVGVEANARKAALAAVARERARQVEGEGHSARWDDEQHAPGALALAGACYAQWASRALDPAETAPLSNEPPAHWPWAAHWWKPTTPLRAMEKAGALILAEAEKLHRGERTDGE